MKKENYETFFNRLRPVLSEDDLFEVDLAYALSKHAHRYQRRTEKDSSGMPLRYFEHPRRVAISLIDEAKCFDPTVIIAALFHDGLEDTRFLTYAKLKYHFGRDVARIVQMLTKDVNDEEYIARLIQSAGWRALLIKAADRLDNLRSLPEGNIEFQRKQILETRQKYYPVFDMLLKLTPLDYKRGAQDLFDKIGCIVVKYETSFERIDKRNF